PGNAACASVQVLVPQVLRADVFTDLDARGFLEDHADGHRLLVDRRIMDGDLVDELPAVAAGGFDGQAFDDAQGRAAGITAAFIVREDVGRLHDQLRTLPPTIRPAGAAGQRIVRDRRRADVDAPDLTE